jgi:rhamnulokinase
MPALPLPSSGSGVATPVQTGPVAVVAIDLGASSGRVMVGEVGPDLLQLRSVARFANEPVRLPDGLHWNLLQLYRHALHGLKTAVATTPGGLVSVAVDSWAVDYGLIRAGSLLGVPFHYRDERRAAGVEVVHAMLDPAELYARNGLQFLPFNTIYQLAADPLLPLADRALLIPDLIGYLLTGQLHTERTNASTTGLLSRTTGSWDRELMRLLEVNADLFPELVSPGTDLGPLLPAVSDFVGAADLSLVAVGSHDTASAVVAVPMSGDDAAYISCGTWGLVGVELEAPITSEASRIANFTNEEGVDGRTRFLTNVMGTWILSESMRTWEAQGDYTSIDQVLAEAAALDRAVPIFDVQDPRFLTPGDMPARIAASCEERGLPAPVGRAATVRSIIESLGAGFAHAVDQVSELSGRTIRRIHVVGGGSMNRQLCQAIADRTGRVVVAGPVEATALGNVLVQGRAAGAVSGSLESLRDLVSRTNQLLTYEPRTVAEGAGR